MKLLTRRESQKRWRLTVLLGHFRSIRGDGAAVPLGRCFGFCRDALA